MAYDIIIANGLIIDGTGAEGYRGGVAITGDTIQFVGPRVPTGNAKFFIDATGKAVCPGFIDVTNHADTVGTLFSHPMQESMLRQGVTTIIGGNCGSSLAPLITPDVIAAIQKWQTDGQVAVNWLSVGEFLETVAKLKPGVNFGTLAGLGILRRGVLGNRDRALVYEDMAKLKYMLGEALKEGAFGLSTGLVYAHERKTTTEELIDIAGVLSREGGIYKTHLRSESGDLLGAVNEAIAIAREGEAPISISHFKAIGRRAWGDYDRALELLDRAAEAGGLSIHFDMYPYITTGSFLYLLLPSGAYEGGFKELFTRLKNPDIRQEIVRAIQKKTLHYDSIIISTAWRTKESIGRSIGDLSRNANISPEEVILHLLIANEGRVTIFGRTVRREHVRKALSHPLSIIASDGSGYSAGGVHRELAHPRSFGAFPRFIRLATQKWKTLSLPEAIYKATGGPAEMMGIKRRGTLKKGNYADIVVFDPATIRSRATFTNPYQFPDGISSVLVNGNLAVSEGVLQEGRHGMPLRRGKA